MITKLKALDRLAVRAMATISRRAPQASIEILIDLLPIDLLIKQTALLAMVRLKDILPAPCVNFTKGPKRHGVPHLQFWHEQLENWPSALQQNDCCNETLREKSFIINCKSFDGQRKHRVHSEYTVYTDGSKTGDGTGAGYVVYHKNQALSYETIKLNALATVFQAELLAIKHAALYIFNNMQAKHVKILSDSQAALKALDSHTFTSKTAFETAEALEELSGSGTSVRLAWVKAHVGLEGNELADSAAKQGAANEMGINKVIYAPISKACIKAKIKEMIYNEWKQRWIGTEKYRMTKQFISAPGNSIGRKVINMSKSSLSRLIQIVTGHNFLSYFQFQLDSTVNPLCRMCEQANETFYHYLTDCDALARQRREFFLGQQPSTDNWEPREIVDFSLTEPINSWFTNKDYLLEQPMLDLDVNYSITDSDSSL
jgi:ribonuclease HI